ncbi:OmpA family protein [Roseateles koreensis]|uniref:OmpA family protein n=1 Tax=Roseateles koreensis TaxID=2987526 RepID=A0ABT5KX92_9BURK|nr:OmpA family protein [Roseateles koreensis]MDC8786968.1 OmpA family protein [Roseateles koreensis]
MSAEQQDDNQRAALWIVGLVVAAVLLVLVGRVVFNQMHRSAVKPAVEVMVEEEVVMIDVPLGGDLVGTVFFATAAAAVPAEAGAEMARAVEALLAAPGRKVVIAGFHDASGDPAKNAALAKARAVAARNALKDAGVDPARVLLRKPESALADGPAEQARRVEIRLID